MYCEHHLVQEVVGITPTIPRLTPKGFATWLNLWIMAYPDQEVSRLQKIAMKLPLDADDPAIDGRPERLPKVCPDNTITRKLLIVG
jgi:hypothetical protein